MIYTKVIGHKEFRVRGPLPAPAPSKIQDLRANRLSTHISAQDVQSRRLSDSSSSPTKKADLVELSGTLYFREEVDNKLITVFFINILNNQTSASQIHTPIKDTGRLDWSVMLPPGGYFAVFQIDGCQPVCHGPYVIS